MIKKELIERINEYAKRWQTLEMIQVCINADELEVEPVAKAMEPTKIKFGNIIVATDIYKCDDGFVGIRAVYHANDDYLNEKVPIVVEEYTEYQSVSYKPKSQEIPPK